MTYASYIYYYSYQHTSYASYKHEYLLYLLL